MSISAHEERQDRAKRKRGAAFRVAMMSALNPASYVAAFGTGEVPRRRSAFSVRQSHPLKECPQCGQGHWHNNRWCSAECCRAWRAEHAGDGRE